MVLPKGPHIDSLAAEVTGILFVAMLLLVDAIARQARSE